MHQDIANARVYVAECMGDEIKIVCMSEHFADILVRTLSYVFEPVEPAYGLYYVKLVADHSERAAELTKLRDLGIPFGGGKEWNPQEIFEYLRDEGYLAGTYLAIGWNRPDHHVFAER